MKNLLILLTAVSAGFVIGRRPLRKRRVLEEMCIEIKADTSQAVSALDELAKKAQQVTVRIEGVVASGAQLQGLINADNYRKIRTN